MGAKTWNVKVHVVKLVGGSQAHTDAIAAAGGTGSSYFTANELDLSIAFANIVAGAIRPEVCDTADNDCNGCTDEGSARYCDVGQTCCAWATPAQRTTRGVGGPGDARLPLLLRQRPDAVAPHRRGPVEPARRVTRARRAGPLERRGSSRGSRASEAQAGCGAGPGAEGAAGPSGRPRVRSQR